MKKIVAVGCVKNEDDIIESFCRHTLTYCDELVLYDHNNTDNTLEILKNLTDEGLRVSVLRGYKTFGFLQEELTNRLIEFAVYTCDADFVLPLDADEFLMPAPGSGREVKVRDVLESFPNDIDNAYAAPWTQFAPAVLSRQNGVFLPKYFEKYINNIYSRGKNFYKVMFSADTVKKKGAFVNTGNHNLFARDSGGKYIEFNKKTVNDLMLAHFPVRSVSQALIKAVQYSSNTLLVPESQRNAMNSNPGAFEICDIFKSRGWMTQDELQELFLNQNFVAPLEYKSNDDALLDYSWVSPIELKYTDYEKSDKKYLKLILNHYESIINDFMKSLE